MRILARIHGVQGCRRFRARQTGLAILSERWGNEREMLYTGLILVPASHDHCQLKYAFNMIDGHRVLHTQYLAISPTTVFFFKHEQFQPPRHVQRRASYLPKGTVKYMRGTLCSVRFRQLFFLPCIFVSYSLIAMKRRYPVVRRSLLVCNHRRHSQTERMSRASQNGISEFMSYPRTTPRAVDQHLLAQAVLLIGVPYPPISRLRP